MDDFNRKVEDASARVSKTVAEAAERIEKEIPEFIKYLNDEVVPTVRQHSTKALRTASTKAHRTGGLHGATKGFEKVKVKLLVMLPFLDSALILLLLTILLVFLNGLRPSQTDAGESAAATGDRPTTRIDRRVHIPGAPRRITDCATRCKQLCKGR